MKKTSRVEKLNENQRRNEQLKKVSPKIEFKAKHQNHDISRFVANTFVDATNRFLKLNIPSA